MVIVYKEEYLRRFIEDAVRVAEGRPILIDRFLERATEIDVDCVSDGVHTVIGAIMEHVEPAGIHSGDSACSIPVRTLGERELATIREQTLALARELEIKGLLNIQFAVKDNDVYILEANPRASRTVPFVGKATGVPLAKIAALCMVGKSLAELGLTREPEIPHAAFKEAVFPFVKFPGVDIALSPEMKSTGEVMGIDPHEGGAYLKAQMAAGNAIPESGNIFVSLRDEDKSLALPLMRELAEMGFALFCTRGTATMLYDNNIRCNAMYRISEGRPNVLDILGEQRIHWIINTPEPGATAMVDEIRMRSGAVMAGVPVSTTLDGVRAALEGLRHREVALRPMVYSLQEYHRRVRNCVRGCQRNSSGPQYRRR